jgi:hypothetical protein
VYCSTVRVITFERRLSKPGGSFDVPFVKPTGEYYTYIYAIGLRGAVKLGQGANVERRLCQLQIGNHRKLRILGRIFAPSELENVLRTHLSKYYIRGEWFRLEGKVREVILCMRSNNLDRIYEVIAS